jgi:hypothetical protein
MGFPSIICSSEKQLEGEEEYCHNNHKYLVKRSDKECVQQFSVVHGHPGHATNKFEI